jgi:hypothetical protein
MMDIKDKELALPTLDELSDIFDKFDDWIMSYHDTEDKFYQGNCSRVIQTITDLLLCLDEQEWLMFQKEKLTNKER